MPTITPKLLTLNLKRSYPVSRERLFAAWTDPNQITQWFGCRDTHCLAAKIDKEVGGDFHIDTTSKSEGNIRLCGKIRAYEPPAKLAFTFAWSGSEEVEKMPPSLVTLHFRKVTDGTELEIVHSEIACEEMSASFQGGWTESMEKLAQQVS